MALKDVPVRARLWAPDRSLPRFFWETSSFFCQIQPYVFCPVPSGGGNARRCRSSVPCCTLGRRRCTKVLPKGAVLHPRATIKHESVAQESRAAPSGDDKCGFSLPKGFLHPYVILPCALGQREGAEESPDCAARHLRVRDSQASSFPESSAPSHAPVVGGVQGGRSHGRAAIISAIISGIFV